MGTCYSCYHNKDYRKISSDDTLTTEPPPSAFPINYESRAEDGRNDFDIIDIEEINNITPRKRFRITFPKFRNK